MKKSTAEWIGLMRSGELAGGISELAAIMAQFKLTGDGAEFLLAWRDAIKRKSPKSYALGVVLSNLDFLVDECGLPGNFWADAVLLAVAPRKPTSEEIALGSSQPMDFSWGWKLEECANRLAEVAAETEQQQRFVFNDTMLIADPGMAGEDVAANYSISASASRLRYLARKRVTDRIASAGEDLLDALERLLQPFTSKRDEGLARQAAEAAIKKARSGDEGTKTAGPTDGE